LRLPAPEIFHVTFDKEHTYVHTRQTDLLARRQENLETKARNEAERVLVDAARDAGVLTRAGENARKVIEQLVRSLGYQQVTVTFPSGG
jgi:NAD(P)H-hydrate repair Nnr-like enzyme with NAD(P)H-hydrate epimerase domain